MADKLLELQSNEPRLMLPEVQFSSDDIRNISYGILYMTNAPFDELPYNGPDGYTFLNEKYNNARRTFKARKLLSEGITIAAARERLSSADQDLY